MYLTMFREPSVGGATLSKLYHGGEFLCDVLEDEVRELPGVPVADWKIHGVTAIPSGVYTIVAEHSQRFGPNTLTLKDVPGYQYIRVHGGNRAHDTEGCLLPGLRNSSATVGKSQNTLAFLKEYVLKALNAKKLVQIEIIPATGVQA